MKNTPQDVFIEILTPTHIGAGKEKEWVKGLDYLYEDANNKVHIINQNKLFEILDQKGILNTYTQKVLDNVEELQDFIIDTQKISYETFTYTDRSFFLPQSPEGEIKTLIRDGLGKPIIAGSSIKGAIYSILLNHFADKHSKNTSNIEMSKNDFKELENNNFGNLNSNNMLMRFLQVTDAGFEHSKLYFTKVFNLHNVTINANNLKAKNSDGTYQNWEAWWKIKSGQGNDEKKFNVKGFIVTYETFIPHDYSKCRITFDEKSLDFIKKNRGLNIPNKINDLITSLNYVEYSLDNLFSIINKHTKEYLETEKIFYQKYSNDKTDEIIEKIDGLLIQLNKCADNKSCVLRLGGGVGYHSITGNWQAHKKDHISDWRVDTNKEGKITRNHPFNKSRKFAFETKNEDINFSLMGFVKLYQNSTWETAKENVISKKQNYLLEIENLEKERLKKMPKPKPEIKPLENGDIIEAVIDDIRLGFAKFSEGSSFGDRKTIEGLTKEHKNNPLYQIGQKIKVEYQIQGKDKNKRTVLKFIEFLD